MTDREQQEGFLARWSRRKAESQRAQPEPAASEPDAQPADTPTTAAPPSAVAAKPAEPAPTLADVAALTPQSDFARFVASGVAADVKNAALKKLFEDPRFNVMDGLDVYIDDYTRSDPLPASALADLVQARCSAFAAAAPKTDDDENADLRLQPHDADRRHGPEPGADGDDGCDERGAG